MSEIPGDRDGTAYAGEGVHIMGPTRAGACIAGAHDANGDVSGISSSNVRRGQHARRLRNLGLIYSSACCGGLRLAAGAAFSVEIGVNNAESHCFAEKMSRERTSTSACEQLCFAFLKRTFKQAEHPVRGRKEQPFRTILPAGRH